MSSIPQPPTPSKAILQGNQLQKYQDQLAPWFDQLRGALGALTLKENHGAVVSEPTNVVAGESGAISNRQLVLAVPFLPLAVLFRAEVLDGNRKSTGSFVGGCAAWKSSTKDGEQSLEITQAPGLASGTAYSMTVVAIPG